MFKRQYVVPSTCQRARVHRVSYADHNSDEVFVTVGPPEPGVPPLDLRDAKVHEKVHEICMDFFP